MTSTTSDAWLRALRTDRVWQLMMLNLAVFVALHVLAWCGVADTALAAATALPVRPVAALTHAWTAVTYMFTQWDFFHLVFNMMWLWLFGLMMTRLMTPGRQSGVASVVGGLVGAAVWVICGAFFHAQGILLGSSAAVLAVVAYGGITLGRTRIPLVLFGAPQVRWLALVVIILCLLTDGTTQGIPTLAVHCSGAIAGVLLGLWQRRRAIRPLRRAAAAKEPPFKAEFTADDEAALDAILDKVRTGGYGALSPAEKKRLFSLSSRITRRKP